MKKIHIGWIMVWALCFACTPDRYEFHEMEPVDMAKIGQIKLCLSHYQLLADGKAEIEFTPILTMKDSTEVADSRVNHSLIEYRTLSGEVLPKNYSTAEASSIGREVKVYASVRGYDLISDTVQFTVTDPSPMEAYEEITVPIVFHLIQSENDIISYGGEIPRERIDRLLEKINNTFSGMVSHNATGVDTKIRFKAALYDPHGSKLSEPGINRIYVDTVKDAGKDQYASFIAEQSALWDYTKYLNIWMLSDSKGEYRNFYRTITTQCIPRYVTAVSDVEQAPEGLKLSEPMEGWKPVAKEVGILYKLQSAFVMVREFSEYEDNELTNCLGMYLGLLSTWGTRETNIPEDYCTDTQGYYGASRGTVGINISDRKRMGDYYFLSENIMDDPTGVHRSVSLQQSQRIHWVLRHCPERSCWKSDFAFTGK